jgi:hypothetical protein
VVIFGEYSGGGVDCIGNFGTVINAKIFLELKPEVYKWQFSGVSDPDSLYIDSVVMVLGWHGTYGDTMATQRIKVYEMDQSNDYFRQDSFFLLRNQYFTYSPANLLGTRDIIPATLNDSVKAFQDTAVGQLRIRLNNSFGQRLLNYDTSNAYGSDSAFKTYMRGFAVEADQSFGNAIMTFGLVSENNTKLAIYYRYTKGGQDDTTVSYFAFTAASARHNYIERSGFSGTQLAATANDVVEDNFVYLINTPGSYATVKVPDLRSLSNRIVHRAELLFDEVYDVSDKTFIPPEAIFLDLYDSTISKFKVVPYDYIPDNTGQNQSIFGMFGKNSVDGFGNLIRSWNFDITRYVQNILTGKEPLHNFRILAHRVVSDEIKVNNSSNSGLFFTAPFEINSYYTIGRVRVGGGSHPTQRMRVRIVYTKI